MKISILKITQKLKPDGNGALSFRVFAVDPVTNDKLIFPIMYRIVRRQIIHEDPLYSRKVPSTIRTRFNASKHIYREHIPLQQALLGVKALWPQNSRLAKK